MSRTTQHELRVLLRDARNALGVRSNRKIWPKLTPLTDALAERLGPKACAVMVSPYTDGYWMIFWIDGDCRENTKRIAPEDLALSPSKFVAKHLKSKDCLS
ncbi:hypothetical protein [Marinobacter sp. F3R08]|uniref:hypothetical protein n=1 Tax=Marinobacter sp. F3R08 TaxID=2841559 RepID=UPI001C09FD7E|nr:hypothetical protein [Marinobacter sp. F3R08]MBU2952184.1 hypothetical protein [Marinobacter sp. F3R08]